MAMTDGDRKELRELIKEGNNSLKEIFKTTLDPIQLNIKEHSEIIKDVPIIKQRVNDHINSHTAETQKKRFNLEMWVVVGLFIADKLFQYFPPS